MIDFQASLFDTAPLEPEGFAYRERLIAPADETALLEILADLPVKPYEFRGYQGLRRVAYFGWRYGEAGGLVRTEDVPDFLLDLRDRAAGFAGQAPEAFVHALINEYRPGAPIGWHRDRPAFGEVVGISLGAPALMRFRRRCGDGWERKSHTLAPRSVYRLSGLARWDWEHSLPPAKALRYSVTFRTLAKP